MGYLKGQERGSGEMVVFLGGVGRDMIKLHCTVVRNSQIVKMLYRFLNVLKALSPFLVELCGQPSYHAPP